MKEGWKVREKWTAPRTTTQIKEDGNRQKKFDKE